MYWGGRFLYLGMSFRTEGSMHILRAPQKSGIGERSAAGFCRNELSLPGVPPHASAGMSLICQGIFERAGMGCQGQGAGTTLLDALSEEFVYRGINFCTEGWIHVLRGLLRDAFVY